MNAIHTLNSTIIENQSSLELACVASVLFTAFEVLRGGHSRAMLHLEAGFRMLRSSSTQNLLSRSSMLDELQSTFSRLDAQASSFPADYNPKALLTPHIPETFSSIVEARDALDGFMPMLFSYTRPHRESLKIPPLAPLPPAVASKITEIQNILQS
jgi:hypothetical protein